MQKEKNKKNFNLASFECELDCSVPHSLGNYEDGSQSTVLCGPGRVLCVTGDIGTAKSVFLKELALQSLQAKKTVLFFNMFGDMSTHADLYSAAVSVNIGDRYFINSYLAHGEFESAHEAQGIDRPSWIDVIANGGIISTIIPVIEKSKSEYLSLTNKVFCELFFALEHTLF